MCARSRKIIGFEALTRWSLSDGKSVSPAEFIPVAEKSGLIVDLGAWLLKQVCEDLSWLKRQAIDIEPRPDPAALENVAEILGQPIRNVDSGAGHAAQR